MRPATIHSPAEPDSWWRDRARCAETDPETFFPDTDRDLRLPKQVCRHCPARAQCLAWALEHDERYGIWGGLTGRERRRILHGAPLPAWARGTGNV